MTVVPGQPDTRAIDEQHDPVQHHPQARTDGLVDALHQSRLDLPANLVQHQDFNEQRADEANRRQQVDHMQQGIAHRGSFGSCRPV